MDVVMVVLPLLHIVFGVFWAGSALFLALILEPRLRVLGPAVQRPAMGAIARVMGPAMGISGLITIVAVLTLYFKLDRGGFDRFLSDGWGWAIFIGFLASIAAYAAGITAGVLSSRMANLGRAIEGHPPTPEEGGQIQRLSSRLVLSGRVTAGLLLIAVGAMASARFV